MELVGNTKTGDVADAAVHHVTASGHHEMDVRGSLEHLCRSLDEIFRTLLEGDPAKEGHHLLMDAPLDGDVVPAAEIDRIVDCHDLVWVDPVLVDDYVAGKVADRDYPVGGLHASFLDTIDTAVDHVLGASVV